MVIIVVAEDVSFIQGIVFVQQVIVLDISVIREIAFRVFIHVKPETATQQVVNGFVIDGYDLILANATPALQAAVSATEDIPILGTAVTEYGVALGIENFGGTVGGNVSGTSDLAPLDGQAQMILDLIPDVKTVGIIFFT